jgi:RHS repeat-associated protein
MLNWLCRALARACPALLVGQRRSRSIGVLAAVSLILSLWLVIPGVASAESLCTDTWTGPSEGPWTTAEDWSTGKVPTSTDVACIGVGKVVKVTGTGNKVGVVQGEGALVIYEASLELTDALEASSIRALSMVSGTLSNAGVLNVSNAFNWWGGSLSGPGSTVLGSGVTAVVEGTEHLYEGMLVNEGTLTFASGLLEVRKNAEIKNVGTFNANSEEGGIGKEGESSPLIVNTGTFQKTKGSGKTVVGVAIDNESSVDATSGKLEFQGGGISGQHHVGSWSASSEAGIVFSGGTFSLGSNVPFSGLITVTSLSSTVVAIVTAGQIEGSAATLSITSTYGPGGTLEVNGPSASHVAALSIRGGTLSGAGTLDVASAFNWGGGWMLGSGSTVVASGVTGTIEGGNSSLEGHTLVNEGTITFDAGSIEMREGSVIKNMGTFYANSEDGAGIAKEGGSPLFVNMGIFEKTKGAFKTRVAVDFDNLGLIWALTGRFEFSNLVALGISTQWGGSNPSASGLQHPSCGDPVTCATGNFSETQADLSVGGQGVGLNLTRYYNSQAAAAGNTGIFGPGWSSSFSDHLVVEKTSKTATLVQGNASTVPFTEGTGGSFTAPAWTQDTLSGTPESGYTLTLANQTIYKFAGANGRLESVTDRNGNATTLAYESKGRVETITDPAGRTITLSYNAEGFVESAKDPMGHVVKYAYEGGNLKSVIEPGEMGARWQFKYDASHEITEMIDGRSGKTINEYNGSHQVISQKDPMEHTLSFEYEPFHTKITNKATGAVTDEHFTSDYELFSITRGFGTSSATTETFTYNEGGYAANVTDGNGHKTRYEYDSAGNRTKTIDPNEHETKWTYNSTHDVETVTTPKGETTTIKRDSHGNPESISRPAPKEMTQTTKYVYDSHGDVESMTDPLGRVWKYEYDSYGDRTTEIDPEGDKRTWAYDEDSREVSTIRPRGNVTGGEPALFKTTIERDAQGRPLTIVEPPREPAYGFAFGSAGSGNGQFQFPTLEALTSSGNLWVSDSTLDRLQEFNTKGEYLTQFGTKGTGIGQFNFPFGIGIKASSGNIYVSDRNNFRMQEFSATGTFVRMFGYGVSDGEAKFEICTASCRVGLKGSGVGQFSAPDGVAIDASGNVWVVDEINNRLEEFSENGEFLHQYGTKGTGNGQLSQPVAIVYDNGNLYVTEAGNERVQEFSTGGAYVAKFGSEGTGNGQFKVPYAIAAGPTTNDLYVTDRENNRVEVFTTAGLFLRSIGSKGKGSGQMELPTGVVANTSEAVYISDHGNERVQQWTAPSPRTTKYAYDANGNTENVTDPNENKTKYTYNADNQQIKVEEPNKTITETGYDGAGNITSQTDGNKHETKYVRNALEQVTEIVDPLGRKTTKEYDNAGNLKTLTDPAKRTTTYTYDPANRLTEVGYSDGKTHAVKYEYDPDGDRTSMTDATGTTTYGYDQLDRLTENKDGHSDTASYEYDLANKQTKITYPNGKTVTRAYDKTGRLEKTTDWLEHTTTFAYDTNSNLTTITFPTGTNNIDAYAYNASDQMTEAKMTKGTETLASLLYTRDGDNQATKILAKGLPGSETTEYTYDENNRLTKAGTTPYEYDPADNPTKTGTSTNTYDNADQLKTGTGLTYTYDEQGERTKTTPTTGPATTYSYDQAGNLTSVERPKEGETGEIKDSYAYDGNGLRASQTITGTTSYLIWDMTKGLPLILNDGTSSYIYGPGNVPVEQISGEKAVFLHHDQAGSTRLITSSTGTVEGSYTYDAYGNTTGHTGTATTPLGYDAQYTSSDTGLIYLRARVYDPATAQFLSVDPAAMVSRAPYVYAGDNPLTYRDRGGLSLEEALEGGSSIPCPWCSAAERMGEALEGAYHEVQHSGEWVYNQIGTEDLGEPAKQGEAAERAGCELLEKDRTGKVHGDIPSYPNPEWTDEELEQVAEDLRDSIGQRKQEQGELGEEPGHRNTIREQEKLLRQIEKRLSGS